MPKKYDLTELMFQELLDEEMDLEKKLMELDDEMLRLHQTWPRIKKQIEGLEQELQEVWTEYGITSRLYNRIRNYLADQED